MKNIESNNIHQSQDDAPQSLPGIEMNYSRSREDVWAQLSEQMDEQAAPQAKVRTIRTNWMTMAAAAVLVLLLSGTAFIRLYTKTVSAPAGQHLAAILPDGSSVELNASSVIKYKPFWWRFDRQVQFEGEAFFKVMKGKKFEVVSSHGQTIVLGTSFNIYSRKGEYKVTCYTGKVRVVSVVSGKTADITANKQAIVQNDGSIDLNEKVESEQTISWMNDKFIFTHTPLMLVFEEIERQYGISITTNENLDYLYSGNFTRDRSVEDVIKMVCRPLGLEYKATSSGFLVSK